MKEFIEKIFGLKKSEKVSNEIIVKVHEEVSPELDFQKLKEDFLQYQDVSAKSVQTYSIALKQFCIYLNENGIKNPTREDIINWREELKEEHKPTTVNGYLIAVRNFFKYLSYIGVYKNITENVKGIKMESMHLKRGFTPEELQKILECCEKDRERLIAHIAFSCALRANEIVNIRLEDFYEDNGVMMLRVLGKGREGYKQESVKIDERLLEMIKKYIQENNVTDYLFESRKTKKGLDTKVLREEFRKIFKKAGIEDIDNVSFHSFRHSSVTISLDLGMSIQEVSESARHKNIHTTMIYKNELDKRNSSFSNRLCDVIFKEAE